jgi:tyrosinase
MISSFAFNGLPYTIYLFLGDKSTFDSYSGPAHRHPQLVGFVYTFSNPVYGVAAGGRGCKNCQTESEEGALSSAQIPLTAALAARQKAADLGTEVGSLQAMGIHRLDGLEGEQVEKYLEKYLHWSVKTVSHPFLFFSLVFSFVHSWLTKESGKRH